METQQLEEAIDAADFAKVRAFIADGDSSFLADLVKVYLGDSGQELGQLRAALAISDTPCVERLAHKLRGSSGTVGARRLSQISHRIEDEAKSGRTTGLETLVKTAEEEFGRVRAALEPLAQATA